MREFERRHRSSIPRDLQDGSPPRWEQMLDSARDRLAIGSERAAMQRAANELGRDVETLGGALRAKEDALATAPPSLAAPAP